MARENLPDPEQRRVTPSSQEAVFQGVRSFGDGFAGQMVAARIQAYDPNTLSYVDLLVDVDGKLVTSGSTGGGGGGGDGAILDGVSSAIKATVKDYANGNPLTVALTDADGNHIATLPVSGTVAVSNFPAVQPVSDNGGSLTVDGPLTDAQLRAAAVPVSDGGGSLTVDGPLTDAQLRAAAVPISDGGGSVTVDGTFWQATQPVSGPLTDTQLRATAVPVSGPLTDAQLRATAVPVSIAATIGVDVTDEATREVGRNRIWDGTDEMTVLPVRTQPATTEKALPVIQLPTRMPVYGVTTIEIAPAITVGVKELLALWYTGGTKDIYIMEIHVASLITTASTAGRSLIRVSTITSAPTGGTEESKVDISGGGASAITNAMRVKTGGGAIGATFIRRPWLFATQPLGRVSEAVFKTNDLGDAIILRGGSSSGISIDEERAVAHTAMVEQVTVGVRWIEL